MTGFPHAASAFLALSDEHSPLGLEELRGANQVLKLVMDHIPELIFWKDRSSTYLGCNAVFCANAGLGHPREIVGKTDYDLPWASSEAEEYRAWDEAVMASGEASLNIQERQLTADGAHIWVETNKVPLRDSSGQVVGILGTAQDITARKLAEEALQSLAEELEGRVQARTKEVDLLRDGLKIMLEAAPACELVGGVVLAMVNHRAQHQAQRSARPAARVRSSPLPAAPGPRL